MRLASLNRFKPSSKIFYWPFQGGTSFVDLLCFCSVLCLLCLCARLFICALWSPAGKGLTSWLSFVVSAVSLSLSHWYLGSGVVLDCIDSWSLHPYLLWLKIWFKINLLVQLKDISTWEVTKTKENMTHKRGQPLLRHETQIAKKDQQKKHLLRMVRKKLLECPNMFDGANCTLIFNVDQDQWCLVWVKDP